MAVIPLQHPIHGAKVACTDMEAAHDRACGWVDFVPVEIKPVPAFLLGGTPLPEDFPAREWLVLAGLTTMESIAGKTSEQLQEIKGIGAPTALKILDAQ